MSDVTGTAADSGLPPVLKLSETAGPVPGPLVRTEGGWLLDLGEVEAGSLIPTLRLAVINDAARGADGLTVRFEPQGEPDIRFFAADAFENLAPGTGRGPVNAVITATAEGVQEATLVLHLEQVAADGSTQPLPDQVLTIRAAVVGSLDAATVPGGVFSSSIPEAGLLTAPVRLDGQDFARIQSLGGWTGSSTLELAPDRATADAVGDHWLLATFGTVHADFSAAGPGRTVEVVGAESGSLSLARGDTALWSFISGGGEGGATIETQGQATVRVTALGADTLDDRLGLVSLLPYNIYPFSPPRGASTYDGHLSTATVELGGRGNTVTAEAEVNLVVTGGEGRNHVVGGGGTNLFALTGTRDWLESGSGQTTFVQQAGSVRGDLITGFDAGDLIRFEGFAADAELRDLGGGRYRVVDGEGRHEAFTVLGVDHLAAGTDYVFA